MYAQFEDNGDELPRIPAQRLGARLNTYWRASAELEFYRVFAQDRIAGRNPHAGPRHAQCHGELHLHRQPQYGAFLRASNLLGEEV